MLTAWPFLCTLTLCSRLYQPPLHTRSSPASSAPSTPSSGVTSGESGAASGVALIRKSPARLSLDAVHRPQANGVVQERLVGPQGANGCVARGPRCSDARAQTGLPIVTQCQAPPSCMISP